MTANHSAVQTDNSYVDKIPANTRGYLHSIASAIFVLLMAFAYLTEGQVALVAALVFAAIDLVLVLMYTRNAWRQALYPVLYAGGSILAAVGVVNELQVAAIIGLAATVLGFQIAASKTPTTAAIAQ